MTAPPAIVARGLVAGRGAVPAVRGLDLTVHAGEVVALLGPNGAGKTTTLLTIAGVLPPLGGEVSVLGGPVPPGRPHVLARRGLVLVPERGGVVHQLTVADNLRLAARGGRARAASAIDEALGRFPALRPLWGRRCGLLSGGEQQMLALARAIVARPAAVMIDELSLGLAPIVVEGLLPAVRALADDRGTAVVVVEQHAHMALAVADRACVLRHGEVTYSGPAAELAARPDLVTASYLGPAPPR